MPHGEWPGRLQPSGRRTADPARTPFVIVAPGTRSRKFVPRLSICLRTAWLAPCPTATMAISAATPDEDAEHRQRAAQLVARDRLSRRNNDHCGEGED